MKDKIIDDSRMNRLKGEKEKLNSGTAESIDANTPTPGEIPLIAFGVIPMNFFNKITIPLHNDYRKPLEEAIKSVRECGFNCVAISGSLEKASLVMEECQNRTTETDTTEKELPSIYLLPPELLESYTTLDDMVDYFKDKQYPWSYLVKRLPTYNCWGQVLYELENLKKEDYSDGYMYWNRVITAQAYLRENDPIKNTWFIMGICYDHYDAKGNEWVNDSDPSNWSPYSARSKNTEMYLKAMQLMFKPSIWSYSFFPLRMINPESSEWIPEPLPKGEKRVAGTELFSKVFQRGRFYHNLEEFHKRAQEEHKPMYTCCMCAGHGLWDKATEQYEVYYPKPTVEMLRFEAFNALAAGARGLVFWKYAMGITKDALKAEKGIVFESAPLTASLGIQIAKGGPIVDESRIVTLEYKEKPLWQAVKTVIGEIKQVQDIFLNSEIVEYGHYGGSEEEYQGLAKANLPFGPITGVSVGSGKEDGVFMSLLKRDINGIDVQYVVMVSHTVDFGKFLDVTHSSDCELKTVFGTDNIKFPVDPPIVGPVEPAGRNENAARNSKQIILAAGGMHIFEVVKK